MPRQVALFTEVLDFDDSYSDLVWKAADSRARERGVDLVVCVGRRLGESGAEPHNQVFRWAFDRKWDGVVLAHIVYQNMDEAQRGQLARRLARHSVCATSVPLGDIPIVGFENASGMRAVLDHLIGLHQKRRILFVSGPLSIEDAASRYRVWEEAAAEAGLPHGPEWVVHGDFNPLYCPDLADEVAQRVLALEADAVVTSSDLVAEVLLRTLPRYGISVPSVAVTGFDDIPLASQIFPSLTTVRQPVRDQFRTAVDWALDGHSTGPEKASGRLVVRGSCGCPEDAVDEPDPRSWRRRTIDAREQTRRLRSQVAFLNLFAGRLDSLSGVGELGELLHEWMSRLGIDSFALALCCQPDGTQAPWSGQDAFAGPDRDLRWVAGHPALPHDHALVYPASELAPSPWWASADRRTVVALPLVVGDCCHGLVLLEVSHEGNLMCRAVQELVASFLDREFRLKREVRRALEATVSSQLETEKNRTLGLLLAGFSHDLATPFSVGQDSIQLLVDGLGAVRRELGAGTLSKSRLEAFVEQGTTLAGLLQSNWTRATDMVERFKRIGTEVPRDGLRRVRLAAFLGDLLESLRPLWRHREVTVHLDADPALEVQTRVSALVDVMTNLLQNALVHAFPDGGSGAIAIGVTASDQRCRLVFEDDGVGVADEVLDRVFEPYVTTKEGRGGTGLGLAVVRQRVQGLLGGTVACERLPKGTRFVVEFPRTLD